MDSLKYRQCAEVFKSSLRTILHRSGFLNSTCIQCHDTTQVQHFGSSSEDSEIRYVQLIFNSSDNDVLCKIGSNRIVAGIIVGDGIYQWCEICWWALVTGTE